jgi:hypothetical protein
MLTALLFSLFLLLLLLLLPLLVLSFPYLALLPTADAHLIPESSGQTSTIGSDDSLLHAASVQ